MSEPINANPTVFDTSQLPTRLSKGTQEQKPCEKLVLKILNLSLLTPSAGEEVPGLMTDVEMTSSEDELDGADDDGIDSQEIFDLISTISDPEHPLTLAQLAVVNLVDIHVKDVPGAISEVLVKITPTITHCSLATLIGLGIRVRLERSLPARFRIKIFIKEGTHQSENQVNKQLNDKERVAAACENEQLLGVILQMLSTCK